jgi:hypothetical protein
MFEAISFRLVPGGWQFAIAGGFDLMVSWLTCFAIYVSVHLGSKVFRMCRKK